MIWTLFLSGAALAGASAFNSVFSESRGLHEIGWAAQGLVGGVLMVAAILLRAGVL